MIPCTSRPPREKGRGRLTRGGEVATVGRRFMVNCILKMTIGHGGGERASREPRVLVLAGMRIFYTTHARMRMRARGISEDEVASALENRQITYSGRKSGKTWVVSTVSGRSLKVLIKERRLGTVLVITAAVRE